MPKLPTRPHQLPPCGDLPRTNQEAWAEAFQLAELELQLALQALKTDPSKAARERFAQAVCGADRLADVLPLVASGLADVKA